MKKFATQILLACLLAGCSGHGESATESAASFKVDAEKSYGIEAWVRQMTQNPEVIATLNRISPSQGDALDVSQVCTDPDTVAAMRDLEKPVIVARGNDNIDDGLEILRNIPKTGSKFESKNLPEIESLVEKMRSERREATFSWTPEDANAIVSGLREKGFDPASPIATEAFVAMLNGEDCEKILPRYCAFVRDQVSANREAIADAARLDALLTCELTAWAGALRLNYPANDYKFDRVRHYISDEAVVGVRKHVFVEKLEQYGVKQAFAQIAPPDPQYEKLIVARQIYVDAIEAGGWPEVKSPGKKVAEAVVGKSYDYVPALRARLKAEGYPIDDVESDVMDDALVDSVVLYREVHQLSPKSVIDNTLFRNLAVGPQNRLEMIDLTIQKYRETASGSLWYYFKVNIPDFYVEIWKAGVRIARHRIVVGNNKMQLDPETKKPVPDLETLYPIYPNRTPMVSSKINQVVYQPYWNVPARIRTEELEPKLALNPNYYVENFYEEVNVGDPKLYYVRELPNPNNSLGKVKFLFPNPHSVYLHDTPLKSAFKNPLRGYSHGCMRVENPLDVAEIILKNDGQWDEKYVDSILKADPAVQVEIDLKHPVDVDVVYYNTRVDDRGVVAFLSDIYEYDAIRLGRSEMKRLPKPAGWKPPKAAKKK